MKVLIGPANYAGQATSYARALNLHSDHVASSAVLKIPGRPIQFPADIPLPGARWALDPVWRASWRRRVTTNFDAVLMDGGLPITRGALGWSPTRRPKASRKGLGQEIEDLRALGLRVGLLLHGSEIRDPDDHRAREVYSPFHTMDSNRVAELRRNVRLTKRVIDEHPGPVFVTTPDLLFDCPTAIWAPLCGDIDTWTSTNEPSFEIPRILHAPTDAAMAGSGEIEASLAGLRSRGQIQYLRVVNSSPAAMPTLVKNADIVVDKCSLGSYGAIAMEAMFAGRLVLGHVRDEIRNYVGQVEGAALPIVEITPLTIDSVISDIIDRPDHYREIARRGFDFAASIHNGESTALRLSEML